MKKSLIVFAIGLLPMIGNAYYINNQSADFVIGQQDMISNQANQGSTTANANTLKIPMRMVVYNGKLIVADRDNNRVLIYNQIPTSNNANADVVIGQPDFSSTVENQNTTPNANTLCVPISVFVHDDKLFVADTGNNRVLIFNTIPTSNNASADVVIGQPNMGSYLDNQGNPSPSANTFAGPLDIDVVAGKLVIVDTSNNRILIFNSIPTSNNASADIVIGQTTLNDDSQTGVGPNIFSAPQGITTDGISLFLADQNNHRVVIFNQLPTTHNASANLVIGQADLNSVVGQTRGANTLNYPGEVIFDGERLIVYSGGDRRILVFNEKPTVNHAHADVVIGQENFSNCETGVVFNNRLGWGYGLARYEDKLLISSYNNRILIFSAFPQIRSIYPNYICNQFQINTLLNGDHYINSMQIGLIKGSSENWTSNVTVNDINNAQCDFTISTDPGIYKIQSRVNGFDKGVLNTAFFILEPNTYPIEWQVNDMGQAGNAFSTSGFFGIAIGDADNDGFQDVFAAGQDQKLIMLKKFSANWSIDALPVGPSGEYYTSTVVCDTDNDGTFEVYGGTEDKHIYQFKGASWDKTDIGLLNDTINQLTFGDGDNDGEIELYAACADGHIYQIKKNAAWDITSIGNSTGEMNDVEIGDGNNDRNFEIYAASDDHKVYQLKYNGVSWEQTIVGSGSGAVYGVASGDGDGDGQFEVYSINQDGNIYQHKYSVSSWNPTTLGSMSGQINAIAVSDAENVGQASVFCSGTSGKVVQFKYENNTWSKKECGSVETALRNITISDGDNDNQFEVYAIGENNHVYQFKSMSVEPSPTPTPSQTITPTPLKNFDGQIISKKYVYSAPNPIRSNTATIVIHTNQPAEVSAKLFTTTNREVFSFKRNYSKGKQVERLYVGNLANGVYLLLVEARDDQGVTERVLKRIALIK